ncbi:MAG: nucleotidyltransferase family protein [Spirulina sp.]
MNTSEIIQRLKQEQKILQNMGARSLSLFGSVARNEARADSDIDLLVDLSENCGLFEFFRLRRYLEEQLNCAIDLGTVEALREHLRQPILEEAIRVF